MEHYQAAFTLVPVGDESGPVLCILLIFITIFWLQGKPKATNEGIADVKQEHLTYLRNTYEPYNKNIVQAA